MRLNNEKILLISPETFSYSSIISYELKKQGFDVEHWNSRLNESSLYKICLKFFPSITKKYSEYFYLQRINSVDIDKLQYVLVIKADGLTEKVIIELKKKYPNAKFALYLWDSIKNLQGIEIIVRQFELVATFEPGDSQLMGWKYRPLFSTTKMARAYDINGSKYIYDLCFIGTNHSDRLNVINKIMSTYRGKYQIFIYIFFQKEWILSAKKFFNKGLLLSDDIIFSSNAIDHPEYMKFISNSRAVLDIEHPNQGGLTMRTIEALTSNRKIITTNASIAESDLFHPSRVQIINRHNPKICDEFIFQDFMPIEPEVLERYSVQRWFLDIFGIEGERGVKWG